MPTELKQSEQPIDEKETIVVEKPADEKPAETADESATSETPSEEKPEVKADEKADEKPKGEDSGLVKHLRKTIDHLSKKTRELERRFEQGQEIPPPVKENFTDDAEFTKANQKFQETQSRRSANEMQRAIEETQFEHEDFDINSIGHLNFHIPTLANAVNTLQHGKDILYYLTKNPDEASELSLLSKSSPAAFEQKLVEIHAGIRKSKVPVQPKAKKVSDAPKPIKPIGGNRGASRVDPAKMTDKEWLDWRRTERAQKFKQQMGVT
jgi:hypothetical protein